MATASGEKVLVLFDLDGTLTTKDTFLEFIKFYHGTASFYAGFALLSPWLVSFKLGLIPNWKAKERVLRYFFAGEDEATFRSKAEAFADQVIPTLLRPEGVATLRRHQADNHHVVVVTASAEDWVGPWCKARNLQIIGTRLQRDDQKITGMLATKNCHGEEKVCRIRETLDLSAYDTIYAYGDSSGDKPMLALAHHPFYKPFRG
ncbi:HAD-IB family hydrolase [Dawidia soli]|uniref:HAD-IB family hydrolase n=1 Tax=Dawidia soli TaxID=2782352 RepID=A0AAP2D6N9_9BACT|nr:HAD-IB family hydrolase [Dawidia soli]MBT1686388.1 HAD-IB family hydrolase [Dawidia soli]